MKKKSVVLRKGTEQDLGAFFRLYWISSLEHTHYSGTLDSLKTKKQCKKHIISRQQELLQDPKQFFFVAEETNKIIGMATGHVGQRDEAVIYATERIGFVDEICTHPDYRNSGVGGKLRGLLLKELYKKKSNLSELVLLLKIQRFISINPMVLRQRACGLSKKKNHLRRRN